MNGVGLPQGSVLEPIVVLIYVTAFEDDVTSSILTFAGATSLFRNIKATVTPDCTISGSSDWLRLGQGATDPQYLLRSPAAVEYRDR